jgi:DNA sulfur modification protein DndD
MSSNSPPPSPQKPVVLVGALNGGGKTTLLDAIQLALYGKFAKCSNRGNKAYLPFLKDAINRSVDPKEGAAVEVQFRHTIEGKEYSFRVHRSWHDTGKNISEHVEVFVGGTFDQVVTDSWYEVVEDFLPARLSYLFFFDGEKIEALADLEQASDLLKTAIHSLLGIDTVEQLSQDLIVLERRKRTDQKGGFEREEIDTLTRTIRDIEERKSQLVQESSAVTAELGRVENAQTEIDKKYTNAGGVLLQKRRHFESERKTIQAKIDNAMEHARLIASSAAPLLLVKDLLSSVVVQAEKEEAAIQSQLVSNLLRERDEDILHLLKKKSVPSNELSWLQDYLATDRDNRQQLAKVESYLQLSPESTKRARHILNDVLPDTALQSQKNVHEIESLNLRLIDIDRKLASIPDEDAIAVIVKKRQAIYGKVYELNTTLKRLQLEIDKQSSTYVFHKTKLDKLLERKVEHDTAQDDVDRLVLHSKKTRNTLEKFQVALVSRHVEQISQMILESFDQLTRKEKLLTAVKIDPENYAITLLGEDEKPMPAERLSAGERQLLSVSILWGLARASGRPLPTIIDTPLGRLDSSHRTFLLERYFPYASHQVLLLSTDEEITSTYLDKVRKYIGQSYLLEYDDTLKSTTIKKGYFWN